MVNVRSTNEIILSLIDYYKLTLPDADTKPGTVVRNLAIDSVASQLSLLYDQLSNISQLQSLRLVVGSDLDNLAKNFGLTRKQATPSSVVALLTFSSIPATININSGSTIIANNGFTFTVTNGIAVSPSSINYYQSVATKFSAQLALAGITDQYAVEVTVAASTAGVAGNIGSYSLSSTTIPGVSNVTNVNPATGGNDQENDAAFRNRILSSFSGSSVGTTLGYLNTALGTTGVSDAYVAGPGDPLMTRDGTVSKVINGVLTVTSEGSGGKVDVIVLGDNLVQNTDTFIYQDKSNRGDPTSSKNNFVLGQIASNANMTINQKRVTDIAAGTLPAQPVAEILTVTGSLSGGNFAVMNTDEYGRVTGNFNLIKDTGAYAGSPFGLDTFAWISNEVDGFSEALIKGQYNGQDALTYTDVSLIPQVQQTLSITNENSTVTYDRSIIQLLHTPAVNVTRVLNVTTGERYQITNQNYDKTGAYNTTGRIQISGNTLPSPSDGLQVDYSWIVSYDPYTDYDGLYNTDNPRAVTDSVDWGLSNAIRNERVVFTAVTGNNFYQGNTSLPIDSVISAKKFVEIDGYVSTITSGIYTGRLSVVFSNLAAATSTIDYITLKNSSIEVYNTAQSSGTFSSVPQLIGSTVFYNTTVILPTDTTVQAGQYVTASLNGSDVFMVGSGQSSSTGSLVTIPSSQINTTASSIILNVTYIALVSDLFSSAVTSLPASRVDNGYILSNNGGFSNFSVVNNVRKENQVVQANNSNQWYVEIGLLSADSSLSVSQVVSVVRLKDGYELWNSENLGTITVGSDGNFQLILSGYNTPVTGDRVLVVYYSTDLKRFQPFSFSNTIISSRVDTLVLDPTTGRMTLALNKFVNQASGMAFEIVDSNNDGYYFSVTDGYLVANGATATVSSLATNFSALVGLTNKKVEIVSGPNVGAYDIVSYSQATNTITITQSVGNITADNIAVIRVSDGKEVWNYGGTIQVANNRILLPIIPGVNAGDFVYMILFNYKNLRKAPTRIVGTTSDQTLNIGTIVINGTTLALAQDVILTATSTGLKLNAGQALRTALGLSSSAALPSNIYLARVLKVEKVSIVSPTNPIVLETLATYDTENTAIQNNLLFADSMLSNPSLSALDFILPSTTNNTSNVNGVNNLPTIGDQIRVSFYYATTNDQESLSYTRIGTLYTNKKFAFLNKIYVASAFNSSQSTKFTATTFNQPALGSRYNPTYNYLAPKQNERIVITYNYNKLIGDVTLNLETSRPVTADVLAKQAIQVELDLTMNVVIDPTVIANSTTTTVLQNLRNALIAALSTTKLGQVIDQITLINIAQGVAGIDRARILYFNVTGGNGSILTFQAQNNQYFTPNNVVINTEVR